MTSRPSPTSGARGIPAGASGGAARGGQVVYHLLGADGRPTAVGEGEVRLVDGGIVVAGRRLSFLDVESVRAEEDRIVLTLWPSGRLLLAGLGRGAPDFAATLDAARRRTRTAGLLGVGRGRPLEFAAETDVTLEGPGEPTGARVLLYDNQLTVEPLVGDAFQVPYGLLTRCTLVGPDAVECRWGGVIEGGARFGGLGRRAEALCTALERRRSLLARRIADTAGSAALADGLGVPRLEFPHFERLLDRLTAPERTDQVDVLLGAATGEPRLGMVLLPDRTPGTIVPPVRLPNGLAAFLLVPLGALVALEFLSGPSATTYIFAGDVSAINRDLRAISFRRAPLALTGHESLLAGGDPLRLAVRRLAPVQRLRAAVRERLIHNQAWLDCLLGAMAEQAR